MKKYFKDKMHYVVLIVVMIGLCIWTIGSSIGFDFASESKEEYKKMYDVCLVYKETGNIEGEYRIGTDSQKFFDEYCSRVMDGYKVGGILGTNYVYSMLISNLSSNYVDGLQILLLVTSLLTIIEVSKITKKKITFKEAFKKSSKNILIGPMFIALLYISAFIVRGPFNPIIEEHIILKMLPNFIMAFISTIGVSLVSINITLFSIKKAKTKIMQFVLSVILIFLYTVITFCVLSYISIVMFDTEVLAVYCSLLNMLEIDNFESVSLFKIIGIILNVGLTYVFAYLTYNKKLNNIINKK